MSTNPQPTTFSVSDIYSIIRRPDVPADRQAQYDFGCDVDVLALTLDAEGRSQSINGRAAIAWTAKNRQLGLGPLVDKGKPIHDICLRKWQYSAWIAAGGDSNFARTMRLAEALFRGLPDHGGFSPADMALLQECRYVAVGVMNGQILDPTHGCSHYMTLKQYASDPPSWAAKATRTLQIEDHIFFAGIR